MTWTYSGDPSLSVKDQVRFLLGDTDSTDKLTLSDEEIMWLITAWDDDLYFAAAAGAEQLAGQFAREVTYSSDGVTFSGTELQDKYLSLAQRLRAMRRQNKQTASPYDGSNDPIYNDPRHNVEEVGRGMHDNFREGANADLDEAGGLLSPLVDPNSAGGYATQ